MGYRKKNIIATKRDVVELPHILSTLLSKRWGKGHDLYRKCIWQGSITVAARLSCIYSGNTHESRGSLHATYKGTRLRGERETAVSVIVLVSLSRKEIASVQC